MITTVNYKLSLSSADITVSTVTFNNVTKSGNELLADYNAADNSFEGSFQGVICDCVRINVFIHSDGPNGRSMKLVATMCDNMRLRNQPINIGCSNGSCSFADTIILIAA